MFTDAATTMTDSHVSSLLDNAGAKQELQQLQIGGWSLSPSPFPAMAAPAPLHRKQIQLNKMPQFFVLPLPIIVNTLLLKKYTLP